MSTDPQVSDLLLQWEERQEEGVPVSVEELCHDCPHLLEEVRRKVAALQAMNPLVQERKVVPHEEETLAFVPPGNVPSGNSVTLTEKGEEARLRSNRPSGPALTVPGYEIERELGRGGMGVVYLARQTSLRRPVALKMILADPWTTEQHRQRFKAETETIARLQHPNIVQIYEVGETADRSYCALEYVDGGNLAEALDGKPSPPRQAAELLATVADAVQAAHARGILHRDLKPANVLLASADVAASLQLADSASHESASCNLAATTEGKLQTRLHDKVIPKLTDFGLAKQLEGTSGLTETGMIMGTPSYMAPEQAAGHNRDLGPPADVYALGAILYEMLTGRPPLVGPTPMDTLTQVLEREPVPPRRLQPQVPRDLETICLKCLQKMPSRRYGTADELAGDLRRFLAGEPIHARPVGSVERLLRWCKRRPAVATLTAAVLALLTVLVVVSTASYVNTRRALASEEYQRLQAERHREVAEGQRGEAVKQTAVARAAEKEARQKRAAAVAAEKRVRDAAIRTRRLLYPYDMLIAQQTWESAEGRASSVASALAAWNPREGEEDLRDFAWRYLWGQMNGGMSILRGHDRSADRDGRRGALRGAWLADGSVVTIDWKHVLRRWDLSTGKVLTQTELLQPGETMVRSDLAANGSLLAVLTNKGIVRLVDPATGKTLRELIVPGRRARFVYLTPEGKRLVARRGTDGMAWHWDIASGKRRAFSRPEDKPEKSPPPSVAMAPDGMMLALRTGAVGNQAALLDLRTMVAHSPLMANTTLSSLAFSPDGKYLAGGNFGGRILVWDVALNKEKHTLVRHLGPVSSLAFSADGTRLASGGENGIIILTDIVNGELKPVMEDKRPFQRKGHAGAVHFLAFSPDGKKLLSGSSDGTARVWDLTRKPGPLEIRDGTGQITGLVCSADGNWIAAGQRTWVRLYDARSGAFKRQFATPRPAGERQRAVSRVAFSPDGKSLAAGDRNGAIHLWSIETGKQVATLDEVMGLRHLKNERAVTALAFSPDGQYLVCGHGLPMASVGNHKQVARVWDAKAKKILHTFAHDNSVHAASFSRDGGLFATGCADGKIRTWNARTWAPGRTFSASERVTSQRIRSMALSPDGSLVAAGLLDGTIHIWEVDSGKHLFDVSEHTREVHALAFSPDGKALVSAGRDQSVRLWHIAGGRAELVLRGQNEAITALAATPDGSTIVSADASGRIVLWRAPEFDPIEKAGRE
jgi:WD40 repeat protein/serine/threonine protein kinase